MKKLLFEKHGFSFFILTFLAHFNIKNVNLNKFNIDFKFYLCYNFRAKGGL